MIRFDTTFRFKEQQIVLSFNNIRNISIYFKLENLLTIGKVYPIRALRDPKFLRILSKIKINPFQTFKIQFARQQSLNAIMLQKSKNRCCNLKRGGGETSTESQNFI